MSALADQRLALFRSLKAGKHELIIEPSLVRRNAQVIEERIELLDRAALVIQGGESAKVLRHARRRLRAVRKAGIDRSDVRYHKVFERGETGFDLQHRHSFLKDYGARPTPPADAGHRLSGGAK